MSDDRAPWEPAGVPRFKVGDRVESDFGSECPWEHHEYGSHFNGRAGTITAIEPWDGTSGGHRFVVRFDDEPWPQPINRLAFAELLPLAPAALAAQQAQRPEEPGP